MFYDKPVLPVNDFWYWIPYRYFENALLEHSEN